MEKRKDQKNLFNLSENNFFGDIRDEEIIEKFNKVYEEFTDTEDAKTVLGRIAGKKEWNPKDEIVLANTTENEYYDLFKNEKGEHLYSFVSTCLDFGTFQNSTDQQKMISDQAKGALQRIASETLLNKRRVEGYGVKIEDVDG